MPETKRKVPRYLSHAEGARRIGVTSAGRSTLAPDVPSLAEAGVQNMQFEMWNAFAAPAWKRPHTGPKQPDQPGTPGPRKA